VSDFTQPTLANIAPSGIACVSTMGAESIIGPYSSHANGSYSTFTAWQNANQAVYVAVAIPFACTVYQMAVQIGGTSSGNLDVGIYDANFNRLVSMGSTAMGSTNSIQVFNVTDTPLTPGTYFLACSVSNTSGVLAGGACYTPAHQGLRALGVQVQSSALPLPSTATPANAGGTILVPNIAAFLTTTA